MHPRPVFFHWCSASRREMPKQVDDVFLKMRLRNWRRTLVDEVQDKSAIKVTTVVIETRHLYNTVWLDVALCRLCVARTIESTGVLENLLYRTLKTRGLRDPVERRCATINVWIQTRTFQDCLVEAAIVRSVEYFDPHGAPERWKTGTASPWPWSKWTAHDVACSCWRVCQYLL